MDALEILGWLFLVVCVITLLICAARAEMRDRDDYDRWHREVRKHWNRRGPPP